jgi:ABC-type uncharacterized transport system permease subunit
MAAGFAFSSVFLFLRGRIVGSCPITNLFEVLVFLSWSIVLIYLLVGPTYRLSLMGAFTAPLVLGLMLLAQMAPLSSPVATLPRNPWVEFHAALSIIAYGAFGLGAIAGIMYLVQERLLKSHRASNLLFNLPPISDLGAVNGRLLLLGFVLLSIAFGAGIVAGLRVTSLKAASSLFIWALYGTLLACDRLRIVPSRRIAAGSVAVFILALITLPSVSHTPAA